MCVCVLTVWLGLVCVCVCVFRGGEERGGVWVWERVVVGGCGSGVVVVWLWGGGDRGWIRFGSS